MNDYASEMEFAVNLAKQAKEIALRVFGLQVEAQIKADKSPVTQADLDINELVIEAVKVAYPEYGVLGEEASFEPERKNLWVVDPIDGTQPFTIGAPLSTFCLGLVEDGEVKLGVVYDFFTERLYSAIKGQGAYVNGDQKLMVSQADSLEGGYVVLSSRMGNQSPTVGEYYDWLNAQGATVFAFRSGAYGYMSVAASRSIAAITGFCKPWDLAAPKVILEEAGATITDFSGRPINYDQTGGGVLITNGRVHQTLLDGLKI